MKTNISEDIRRYLENSLRKELIESLEDNLCNDLHDDLDDAISYEVFSPLRTPLIENFLSGLRERVNEPLL